MPDSKPDSNRRVERVNSLLKEVLSEVIRHDLKHQNISELITVVSVDTSKDIRQAKVAISLIDPSESKKKQTVALLQNAASYIALLASKKVTLRYFPALTFHLDDTLDKYMKIDSLLKQIEKEKEGIALLKKTEEEDLD